MTRKPVASPSLPIKDWPQLDRLAWEAASRPAGPLDAPSAALRWAAATRESTVNTWGRYLGFLKAQGELDQDIGPDARMTFERCGRFIVAMRTHLAPSTIDATLVFVCQALSALASDTDWTWIRKHPAKPTHAEISAARKVIVAPDSAKLLIAAFAFCDACGAEATSIETAAKFRDAVLIAFATCTAVRRRNLAEMRLGVHLRTEAHGMRAVFDGTVKNHQIIDTPLTPMLAGYIRTYLDTHRPVLLAGAPDSDCMWIDMSGQPLTEDQIYAIFRRMGLKLLGQKLSVHSVRYGLATGIMSADPRNIETASAALAHRNPSVTRRAYDRSGSDASNRVWARLVERKRRAQG